MVRVFGDIGQLQEVGERPHHQHHRVAWQIIEQVMQRRAIFRLTFARKPNGGLSHRLHQLVRRVTLLLTECVAE